jgi:transposase
MTTYSTADIANFLSTQRQNVNIYISKGYLRAIMVDGNWEITYPDYIAFREEYYDAGKRNSSRGKNKKLSDIQIKELSFVISDLQNEKISYKEFRNKYKSKTVLIPQFEDYEIYKRDMCIKFDNQKKGYRYKRLADKYNLSIRSIEEIINQEKRSIF